MNHQKVLITHPLPDDWIHPLIDSFEIIQFDLENSDYPALYENLGNVDALFSLLPVKIDEALLSKAPNLKVIGNMAVGFDNVDIDACSMRGIPVGNTPGVLTEGTADLAFALMLAAARKIKPANQDILDGKWTTWDPVGWLGADIHGVTLGIIGLGKIGKAVVKRAKGFGMKIIYFDSHRNLQVEYQLGIEFQELNELLKTSDFVSIHVPLTSETKNLINPETLGLMKPTSILINSARGGIVDQEALLAALTTGGIAAAGLDVTTPEPLPSDHPLLHLPNCIITPHIGSATHGVRKAMALLTCENIIAGLENKKLPHCVNEEVYSH